MSYIDEKKNVLVIDGYNLFYVIKSTDVIGYNLDCKSYKSNYEYDGKFDTDYIFKISTIYGSIQFIIYSYEKEKIKAVEDIKKWLKDSALERSSSFL